MTEILTVKGLDKNFGRKKVLNNLAFSLNTGRVVGLMGPNTAGKTTLIKILSGLYRPTSGHILIDGQPVGHKTRKIVSYMPDRNHLFPWMNTIDAIHYYRDMFSDFDSARAGELCDFFRIDENEKVNRLSNGMLKRVLVMLTLARQARLYLLDEPIGGIDPLGCDLMIKAIRSTLNPDSTFLLSTHQVRDVETLLDDVLFLNNGCLIFNEPAEDIREKRGQSVQETYLEVFKNA